MSYLEMALKVSRVRQLAEMPEPENGSASVPGVRRRRVRHPVTKSNRGAKHR